MRKALTIIKDDSQFDGFPDFEELRRIGLSYIAGFSGDLWTDHNTHDPGITILEVLCYALTDLGYRVSLDPTELLAPLPGSTEPENNFFTPEEILTNNPLTLLDYRKMLVDIEGVRNAWIEPATEQEVALWHACEGDSLATNRKQRLVSIKCIDNQEPQSFPHTEVKINGLYRVYLDLEIAAAVGASTCADEEADESAVLAEVRQRLHRHRNLCEDFIAIEVLKDEEIGICTDLELEPDAQPDAVLLAVYEALENFIAPRLPFYSLREMLAQGHPIEAIYRGRPFTPEYRTRLAAAGKFSHGFVDEEQLRESERATEFFASDFYRVIMNVPGVRAIRSLSLSSYRGDVVQIEGEEWRLRLTAGHRPVFSPDRSSFKFFKGVIRLQARDLQGVRERFRKRLADYQKTKYHRSELDAKIPYGSHRSDLGDYYSIQHEFPSVYGIGPGDLASDAPEARRVQALQLQGYLSFFDQLLADYLAQLANLRRLFALRTPPNGDGRTYFSQIVATAPQIGKLARFYRDDTGAGPVERLVRSSRVYGHPVERDQAIESGIAQLRITSLSDARSRLDTLSTESGYRFLLRDTRGAPWLEGTQVFQQEENARAAGESAVQILLFQGIIADNYERENRPANRCYRYYILDNPASYGDFLQEIVESPERYHTRRDHLLNHLLARFGEQFTDYVLLMYALNQGSLDPTTVIQDKERFLANYPAISRNRGRGFDYTDAGELWDSSANLSGLETRVSHLMGVEDWSRRNLNPFSVQLRDQAVYLELRDHRGRLILRTAQAYEAPEAACAAAEALYDSLQLPDVFEPIDCPAEQVFGYQLRDTSGKPWAYGLREFPDPEARDAHLACLEDYFREPLGLTVAVTESAAGFGYQVLTQDRAPDSVVPTCLFVNDQDYTTYPEAQTAAAATLAYLKGGSVQLFNSPNSVAKGFGIKISTTGNFSSKQAVISRYPELFESKVGRQATKDLINRYLSGLLKSPVGIMARLEAHGGGYYFQALGTDESSVYLQTIDAATSYAAACTAGGRLLEAARDPDNYVATSGSFGTGRYSFKVVGAEQDLGQHPRGYAKDSDRDLALKEVADFLTGRELKYEIRREASRFFWRVTAGDPVFELRAEQAFGDAASARAAWEAVADAAANPLQYRLVAGESGQWLWELRRSDSLVLARSVAFPEQDAARAARKSFTDCLRTEKVDPAIHEEKGGYYFVLRFEGADALVGTDRYPDAASAACAFLHFTAGAAAAENYQELPYGDACRFSFEVWEADKRRAIHPRFYLPEEKAAYQERLIDHIAANRHPFLIKHLAGEWNFLVYWEDCGGDCEVLFRQTQPAETDQIAAKESLAYFLEHTDPDDWENLSSEEGFSWLAEVAGPEEQTIAAAHPRWYATVAERDRQRADAAAYITRYQRLNQGEEHLFTAVDALRICGNKTTTGTEVADCEYLQPYTPAGESCILSGFSLRKDDRPLAMHPISYLTAAERDAARNRLLTQARCGAYRYSRLQLSGEKIIHREGLRYYYEWWTTAGASVRRLWRSVASYESEAAAREAFERDRLAFLALATRAEAYGVTSLSETFDRLSQECDTAVVAQLATWHGATLPEEEQLVLYQGTVPVLFLPENEPAAGATAERIEFARYYPIYQTGNGIRFRLLDPDSGQADWRSVETFDTEAAAWAAFRESWIHLPHAVNYLPLDKPEPCIFELELVSTLLVSERTYADPVTVQTLAIVPGQFEELTAAETALSELRSLAFDQLQRQLVPDPDDERRNYFQLIDPTGERILLRSSRSFVDAGVLRDSWALLLEAVQVADNFSLHPHPEGTGYQIVVSRVSLPESSGSMAGGDSYYIEQAEYHAPEYPVIDELCLPVIGLGDPVPIGRAICPKAWNNGLKDFLIYGTHAENYYPFFDATADCGYRFRVVTDRYRLARNPRESHTPAERECLLDWLYHHANCALPGTCTDPNELPLTEPYRWSVFGRNGQCYYRLIVPESDIDHWDSYEGYDDEAAARAAYDANKVALLGNAQEPDCYELIRAESPDDMPRWRLGLLDANGRRAWISRSCFRASEFNAAVLERIQRARTYPFFFYRGSYGFQQFSPADLPDCRQPLASPCLPAKPEEMVEVPTAPSRKATIQVDVPGEVIWESVQEYETLADAECAYRHFICLLTDRRNYQRTRPGDCNLFGLELTHPNEVLATHPQRHASYAAVQRAMEVARACVNAEGLHLIEHILLRPKAVAEKLIPNNCPDCCHAEFLPPETVDAGTCTPPDKATLQAGTDPGPPPGTVVYVPGADPYSFWATVVLPYWPARFQNINFRNFFEGTLRREAPAHVALHICWLDPKQMQHLEYHYRAWLEAETNEGDCLTADAKAALIESLATLTTVYPPAKLQGGECSGNGSQAGSVLLDSTQLS